MSLSGAKEAAEKWRERTGKTYPFGKLRAGSQGLKSVCENSFLQTQSRRDG
jgi:hypothetical protein